MKSYKSILFEYIEVEALLKLRNPDFVNVVDFSEVNLDEFNSRSNYSYDKSMTVWYENHHVVGLRIHELNSMESCIGDFSELRFLFIIECEKMHLPSIYENLRKLEWIEFNFWIDDTGSPNTVYPHPELEIDETFSKLVSLKILRIYGQIQVYLSDFFMKIPNLKELKLEHCHCTYNYSNYTSNVSIGDYYIEAWENRYESEFPENLDKLVSLEKLEIIEMDKLEYLPESIINLPSLKEFKYNPNRGILENVKNLEIVFKIKSLEKLILSVDKLDYIPEIVVDLNYLKELHLGMRKVPKNFNKIFEVKNLEKLVLKGFNFKSVPEAFKLSNLKEIELITVYFPKGYDIFFKIFGNLNNLKSLRIIRNNQLESLPDSLGDLTNIQKLELVNNRKLKNLPDTIGNLRNLQELNLTNNQLMYLPDRISNLTNLQILRLKGNPLEKFPDPISKLAKLQELYFEGEKATVIPESIAKLINLQILDFSGYKGKTYHLESLPASIGNLTNLQELNLSYNSLNSLPDTIGNLTNLQELNLKANHLKSLPDTIGNLTSLQNLNLSVNNLTNLPNVLGNLTALQRLKITHNQFSVVPDTLGNLTNLQILDLSYNRFEGLPDTFVNLIALKELDLRETGISENSKSIKKLLDNNVNIIFRW